MSTVIIPELRPIDVETFLYELDPAKANTVLGGVNPYIYLTNITDSVTINSSGSYTVEAGGKNSLSYHDNTINTTTYSRSVYNIFHRH